jgi:rhodanese-related sulfurtransferase
MINDERKRALEAKGIDWRRLVFVEPSDVFDALKRGGALVVDTRRAEYYIMGHFNGAVQARGRDELIELPRDYELFVYCACEEDGGAANAALTLLDAGYERVRVIHGGLEALNDEARRRAELAPQAV